MWRGGSIMSWIVKATSISRFYPFPASLSPFFLLSCSFVFSPCLSLSLYHFSLFLSLFLCPLSFSYPVLFFILSNTLSHRKNMTPAWEVFLTRVNRLSPNWRLTAMTVKCRGRLVGYSFLKKTTRNITKILGLQIDMNVSFYQMSLIAYKPFNFTYTGRILQSLCVWEREI